MDQYHFTRPVTATEAADPARPEMQAHATTCRAPFQRLSRYVTPAVPISRGIRAAWLLVAVICTAVLCLAVQLKPDPRGIGTHEALGLYPCGFALRTGLPCPTCGMTTAFAHVMHGHPGKAFIVQPAGALMCLATAAQLVFAAITAWRGRMVNLRWERIDPVRLTLVLGFVFLGSWGIKIALGLMTGELPMR